MEQLRIKELSEFEKIDMINRLTAQLDASRALLAERDGEIERWLCEYNKLKGDAERLKSQLTAAKDAISIYEDGLKALQPEAVMEAEGKYLDKIGVLQQDNRNLRAELGRLKGLLMWCSKHGNTFHTGCPECVTTTKERQKIREEGRKQAAQECVNILQNKCNQWLEKHRLDSSWQSLAANEIRHKFGLEG